MFDKVLADQVTTSGNESVEASSNTAVELSRDIPIDLDIPEFDCQYVFAAWEKFGKTTTLNKTDPEGCCSLRYDVSGRPLFDNSKVAQIGNVGCSGIQVFEM